MRVVLSFPGCHRRGGVERIVFECSHYLAERGHDVVVLVNEFEAKNNSRIRHEFVEISSSPKFLLGYSYYKQAAKRLTDLTYDVLNVHGCVCPIGGIHWSQSLHIAWLDRAKQFRRPWSSAWFKQRLNPLHPVLLALERHHFQHRNYQHVIVTTPQVRSDLNQYYGVPESDVTIVPNGFSPSEFSPALKSSHRTSVRQRLGLRDDEIALLFVANELERKGYNTILRALAILNCPNLKLLVVGRASPRDIQQKAELYKVHAQVVNCGSTSNVAEYHAAADLFVLPTQYEAFCLAILEALGSGLPVVTSNVPGAADAIMPGVNGTLVQNPLDAEELASAIQPLLDATLRSQFASAAPETVEKYQWPKVLEAYEQVLCRFSNGTGR